MEMEDQARYPLRSIRSRRQPDVWFSLSLDMLWGFRSHRIVSVFIQ